MQISLNLHVYSIYSISPVLQDVPISHQQKAGCMHERTCIAVCHRVWHAAMAIPQWKWSTCTAAACMIWIICRTAIGQASCFNVSMACFGSARHSSSNLGLTSERNAPDLPRLGFDLGRSLGCTSNGKEANAPQSRHIIHKWTSQGQGTNSLPFTHVVSTKSTPISWTRSQGVRKQKGIDC